MKKYLLFIIVLFNTANCSELAYPSWYCNTYEDKYYIYSCNYGNSKENSINNCIKNISNYIYNRLNNNYENNLIAYRKLDLIQITKINKTFFTKVSLNKNELLTLYNEKLNITNQKINDFINKDISPLIKYKNKEELYNYISTAKRYIEIINFLSKNEIKLNLEKYNIAKNYLKNIKLDISINLNKNMQHEEFLLFLTRFFEKNGINVINNSQNKLNINIVTRKDFINDLYYQNIDFEFELIYNGKIQLYNFINLEDHSNKSYNDAKDKIFYKIITLIEKNKIEVI